MAWPYEIRGAVPADEDQLLEVASYLNTVNLPNDREEIRGILESRLVYIRPALFQQEQGFRSVLPIAS